MSTPNDANRSRGAHDRVGGRQRKSKEEAKYRDIRNFPNRREFNDWWMAGESKTWKINSRQGHARGTVEYWRCKFQRDGFYVCPARLRIIIAFDDSDVSVSRAANLEHTHGKPEPDASVARASIQMEPLPVHFARTFFMPPVDVPDDDLDVIFFAHMIAEPVVVEVRELTGTDEAAVLNTNLAPPPPSPPRRPRRNRDEDDADDDYERLEALPLPPTRGEIAAAPTTTNTTVAEIQNQNIGGGNTGSANVENPSTSVNGRQIATQPQAATSTQAATPTQATTPTQAATPTSGTTAATTAAPEAKTKKKEEREDGKGLQEADKTQSDKEVAAAVAPTKPQGGVKTAREVGKASSDEDAVDSSKPPDGLKTALPMLRPPAFATTGGTTSGTALPRPQASPTPKRKRVVATTAKSSSTAVATKAPSDATFTSSSSSSSSSDSPDDSTSASDRLQSASRGNSKSKKSAKSKGKGESKAKKTTGKKKTDRKASATTSEDSNSEAAKNDSKKSEKKKKNSKKRV